MPDIEGDLTHVLAEDAGGAGVVEELAQVGLEGGEAGAEEVGRGAGEGEDRGDDLVCGALDHGAGQLEAAGARNGLD